jgi:hypothetical protein
VTLEDLNIDKYPVTSAGKVRKNILKELVCQHFSVVNNKEGKEMPSNSPLTPSSSAGLVEAVDLEALSLEDQEVSATIQQLVDIWSTLVVSAPGKDDPLFDFADSITLLRYTDKVWRTMGKKLYLQDFLTHDTVELQAQLLQTRETATKDPTSGGTITLSSNELVRRENGPPGVADIAHVNGDPQRFIETRNAASKILDAVGLSWEHDVEDVIPIKDSFFAIDGASCHRSLSRHVHLDHNIQPLRL